MEEALTRDSSKAGFSLVEVIIASLIFLIVSMGFTAGFVAAMKTNYLAGQYYRAAHLARNQIQQARTLSFN